MKKGMKFFSLMVLAFVLLGLLVSSLAADDPSEAANRGIKILQDMQNAFRLIAQKIIPSVVEIRTTSVIKLSDQWPFQFRFNNGDEENDPKEYKQAGLGSGVIVERRGNKVFVLTNHHVVQNASEITIQLADKRQFNASLVGSDSHKDLALLAFETNEAVPIAELGDSDTVAVGDWVMAVGNPLGYSSTITVGIVSAIGRERVGSSFTDYIQTDAAINQGNSGGALVNIFGQVIGINSWIASPSGGNVGLGFAIPINKAKKDIQDFLTKGKVEYGWLGVSIGDISASLAKELLLENKRGAFIFGIYSNGPAAAAGIKVGDFIIAVDDRQIKSSSDLLNAIANLTPQKQSSFKILRGGKEVSLKVTLGTRPDDKTLAENIKFLWPAFTVDNLSEEVLKRLKLENKVNGVLVSSVTNKSQAQASGLKAGDIITKINNSPVTGILDFYRLINENTNEFQLRVLRSKNEVIFVLKK